jgi:undecaprenyl-diphosphatase
LLVVLDTTRTLDWYGQSWARGVITPWLDVLAFLVTLLGDPLLTGGVAVLLALKGWQTRGKSGLTPLLLFVGVVLEAGMKYLLPHPGPPPEFAHPLALPPLLDEVTMPFRLHLDTPYSFPSGHMLRTTFLVAILYQRNPRWRLAGWGFICGMAFTRVYLNDHWLSDVGGGILLGLTLAAMAAGIEMAPPRPQPQEATTPGPVGNGLMAESGWEPGKGRT